MFSAAIEEAYSYEDDKPGRHYRFSRVFGPTAPNREGAQTASLVELQTPAGVIPPHFHLVDQFQVVVAGSGRIGKHAVTPVSVHYTDAGTPYGPIVADGEGISFFTLRAQHDASASHYMPGSRAEMPGKAGRGLVADIEVGHAPHAADGNEAVSLMGEHADGLAASRLRVSPGEDLAIWEAGDGPGSFYLVLAGSLRGEGRDYPRWSLLYTTADDAGRTISAGDAGADILAMRFPRPGPTRSHAGREVLAGAV